MKIPPLAFLCAADFESKNIMLYRILTFFILAFFAGSAFSAPEISPSMFEQSLDRTLYSQRGAALRVCYSSFKVLKYTRVMKLDLPTSFRLYNLRLFVYAQNITDAELAYAKTQVPFSVSASPFTLTIKGKINTLTIKADEAFLTPLNTVSLKGGVRVISDTKTVNVGDTASLELRDRLLYLSFATRKIAFKF